MNEGRARMASGTRRLIWIILIGGSAVLASYVYGFVAQPSALSQLWDVLPEAVRSPYVVSIGLATISFFVYTAFLLRVDANRVRVGERWGYVIFLWLYILILIPSALYVPLGIAMVQRPGSGLWIGIRLVLGLVAVGAWGLEVALATMRPREPVAWYWMAVAGSAVFAFHTTVLDAIAWPTFFAA
jgi:hypothetical protein